jgi:hypothetical protein
VINNNNNLETIPGQHSIDSLQKTATLGTSHIIREVLQAETRSLSGEVHRWLKRRSIREERKPVMRNDDDDDDNNSSRLECPEEPVPNSHLALEFHRKLSNREM